MKRIEKILFGKPSFTPLNVPGYTVYKKFPGGTHYKKDISKMVRIPYGYAITKEVYVDLSKIFPSECFTIEPITNNDIFIMRDMDMVQEIYKHHQMVEIIPPMFSPFPVMRVDEYTRWDSPYVIENKQTLIRH